MNFPAVRLSFRELVFLRRSAHHRVPVSLCARLLRLKLVEETTVTPSPGSMPCPTGFVRISSLGEDFLRYYWSDMLRFWLPVSISVASLMISIIALIASILP